MKQPKRFSGYFGDYGGKYVPETLLSALDELEKAYYEAVSDSTFQNELELLSRYYSGRPTPLYYAKRLTELSARTWPTPAHIR